jgi:hypothetical protein
VRDHEPVAALRPHTREYDADARARLGIAVTRARQAAGYPKRPGFLDTLSGVGITSLVKLETGKPVGPDRYEPVATSHATLTRLDLVVARLDKTNNQVLTGVVTGTAAGSPVVPDLTRNSAIYEVPLAVIAVAAGAVTVTAANVTDARQWGGPPVTTVTDDFLLYGDRISSCQRISVADANAVTNGFLYFVRMHSLGDQTVSQIRMHPTTLPVAGTTTVRIFRGYRQDRLTSFVDPTTTTFLYSSGGSAASVHTSAFPATTFRAGEVVVVAVLGLSTTTAAQLSTQNTGTLTGGESANLLNPSTTATMVTGFKSGVASMPTTLNLLDGSWTRRDRMFWVALA